MEQIVLFNLSKVVSQSKKTTFLRNCCWIWEKNFLIYSCPIYWNCKVRTFREGHKILHEIWKKKSPNCFVVLLQNQCVTFLAFSENLNFHAKDLLKLPVFKKRIKIKYSRKCLQCTIRYVNDYVEQETNYCQQLATVNYPLHKKC